MSDIRLQTADGVTTITLDRPQKKNAITDAMYGEVAGALARAAEDAAVRAVIVTGEGADFCAGNDISMFADVAAGQADIGDSNVQRFLETISTFPKPLIAAVTGRAIGVGVTMLLHCDLVYVAEDAALTMPFIDLGLVPEAGSSRLLPARIGHVRAFALFALGEPLSGADAVTLGLANSALPAGEVLSAAREAAQRLAAKPASGLVATKRLMRDAEAIRTAIRADDAAFIRQLATPEAAAAFAAFAARKSKAG